MSEGIRQKLEGARIYVLVGVVCLASFCLLFLRDWDVPPVSFQVLERACSFCDSGDRE